MKILIKNAPYITKPRRFGGPSSKVHRGFRRLPAHALLAVRRGRGGRRVEHPRADRGPRAGPFRGLLKKKGFFTSSATLIKCGSMFCAHQPTHQPTHTPTHGAWLMPRIGSSPGPERTQKCTSRILSRLQPRSGVDAKVYLRSVPHFFGGRRKEPRTRRGGKAARARKKKKQCKNSAQISTCRFIFSQFLVTKRSDTHVTL